MLVSVISAFQDAVQQYLTIRIGTFHFPPQYTAILVAALAAALLSAFKLWRIGKREDRQARLHALRMTVSDRSETVQPERTRWSQWFGAVIARTPILGKSEQQRLLDALAAAGIRRQGHLALFVTIKVCSAVALAGFCWAILEWRELLEDIAILRIAVLLASLLLGWRLPEFILSRMAARRRLQIEHGLPDALDLLVICAEAGLSLDQAIDEAARDLSIANPVVAEELAFTAAICENAHFRGGERKLLRDDRVSDGEVTGRQIGRAHV